jgi:hypothetical protein
MKIKRFNEELDPQTYISAGRSLKNYYGKNTKGNTLIDYGYEKGHGFYNAHIQSIERTPVYTGKITNPTCNFYYGVPELDYVNNVSKLIHSDLTEEQLVSDWKNGNSELSFTLEFRFTSSEELKSKVKDNESIKRKFEFYTGFHLFTMYVRLSHWVDGLKYYNYDEDNEEYINPGDSNYMGITDMFQNTKDIDIGLQQVGNRLIDKEIYGIFADRQSALKFKRNLPSLINPHKEKIMDLLSIIGGGDDEVEDIFDSFNKIRINALYQDEILKSQNLLKIWYRPNII